MTKLSQMVSLSAWVLIICRCCYSAIAGDSTMPPTASDRPLVEVKFALDDKSPTEYGHAVLTLWVSEKSQGTTMRIYNWATQGTAGPETNAIAKAAQCFKLIESTEEPKDLPQSQNDIVTVRCRDGAETLVKKFPRQRVPREVHEVLAIMGRFDVAQFCV